MVLLRERERRPRAGTVEPCLPTLATKPPAGADWLHEIKHDGFRIMARRDSVGIRLITRNGHDFSNRFPFISLAVGHLKLMRSRRIHATAILCAFDLLELDGDDLRDLPIEKRKVPWRGSCAPHMPASPSTSIVTPMAPPFSEAPVRPAARASYRSVSPRRTVRIETTIDSSLKASATSERRRATKAPLAAGV